MTASDRQKRYRVRQQARAQAVFAKATEIELAWFGVNRDGEHIAIGMDGKPIQLIVRVDSQTRAVQSAPEPKPTEPDPAPAIPENVIPLSKPKRIYMPKSWTPDKWSVIVEAAQNQRMPKSVFIEKMQSIRGLDDKQRKHAVAVAQALPDTEDWYTHLPAADVTES